LKLSVKRIQAALIAGLLLFALVLPQSALANGPGISDVRVAEKTATTATIRWATNDSCIGTVYYGTTNTTPLGNDEPESEAVTDHEIDLGGLDPDTVYYYYVECGGERFPVDEDDYRSFITDPSPEGYYSITLGDDCGICGQYDIEDGRCGEVIEVTAVVAVAGTYHICWDSLSAASVVDGGTFTAEPGNDNIWSFYMPETTGGTHDVYLTNTGFDDLGEDAKATILIEPSVSLFSDSPPEYAHNEGPVGTKVTLYGHGFNDGEKIQVEFNDTVVSSGSVPEADNKGSWDFSYTIPDTPGGGHAFIIALEENPRWVVASKSFKVIPEITAPGSATVGQTINIEGTGFRSEESQIEITFRSESTSVKVVVMRGIAANKDGSWTEEIVVPALQRGTYFIDASGKWTRARYVADIVVTLVPGIFLDRSSAPVGDPITVRGGGFTAAETGIRIRFEGQVVASGITANEDGSWTASFDVPVSVFGSHTVSASGDRTPAVENTLDTEAQIIEFSPDEGAPGDLVSITGNGFHGGQDLTITIASATASGSLQTQSNGNFNISFRVPRGSPLGEQRLTVTDDGGAQDSVDFTVTEKLLSTTPLPISPQGNTLRSGEVTFRWQGETGSTTYTYSIEVNTTASSGNIWSKSGLTESSYTMTEAEDLAKNTYYWRVKIVDDYGNEGPWSDYVEFRVSPIPTWVWVVIGLVVLVVLMVVAYRETKFRVTE
jgi:hypothetical protein